MSASGPPAVLLVCSLACTAAAYLTAAVQPSPEARAVAFLAREVPRWRAEHPCYSCHNNGDAARALIAASRRGHDVGEALSDTLEWLGAPRRWDANKREGGFDDRPLARIQFASALEAAVRAGLRPRDALTAAADLVAADQKPDGSWQLDSSQSLGSPATYGTAVATWTARRTLAAADRSRFAEAIARADRWIRAARPSTVLDAAASVLALDRAQDEAASAARTHCLDLLRRGQAPGGGWGPYANAPSEPFDTALVLLALAALVSEPPPILSNAWEEADVRSAIARGRAFLVREQREDGSWPETTRPARQESYAQRISTTGWATLALLETAAR